MKIERHRIALACAGAALWIAAGGAGDSRFVASAQERATAAADAAPARDGVADALAGHGAEMRQFGAQADPMRRAIFFEPVDVENEPAGVPCDHVARRRPDAIAGTGRVALMRGASAPKTLRYWEPPPLRDEADFETRAREFAARQGSHANVIVVGIRSFAWCR